MLKPGLWLSLCDYENCSVLRCDACSLVECNRVLEEPVAFRSEHHCEGFLENVCNIQLDYMTYIPETVFFTVTACSDAVL